MEFASNFCVQVHKKYEDKVLIMTPKTVNNAVKYINGFPIQPNRVKGAVNNEGNLAFTNAYVQQALRQISEGSKKGLNEQEQRIVRVFESIMEVNQIDEGVFEKTAVFLDVISEEDNASKGGGKSPKPRRNVRGKKQAGGVGCRIFPDPSQTPVEAFEDPNGIIVSIAHDNLDLKQFFVIPTQVPNGLGDNAFKTCLKGEFDLKFNALPGDVRLAIFERVYNMTQLGDLKVAYTGEVGDLLKAAIEANNVWAAMKTVRVAMSERDDFVNEDLVVVPGSAAQWDRLRGLLDKYNELVGFVKQRAAGGEATPVVTRDGRSGSDDDFGGLLEALREYTKLRIAYGQAPTTFAGLERLCKAGMKLVGMYEDTWYGMNLDFTDQELVEYMTQPQGHVRANAKEAEKFALLFKTFAGDIYRRYFELLHVYLFGAEGGSLARTGEVHGPTCFALFEMAMSEYMYTKTDKVRYGLIRVMAQNMYERCFGKRQYDSWVRLAVEQHMVFLGKFGILDSFVNVSDNGVDAKLREICYRLSAEGRLQGVQEEIALAMDGLISLMDMKLKTSSNINSEGYKRLKMESEISKRQVRRRDVVKFEKDVLTTVDMRKVMQDVKVDLVRHTKLAIRLSIIASNYFYAVAAAMRAFGFVRYGVSPFGIEVYREGSMVDKVVMNVALDDENKRGLKLRVRGVDMQEKVYSVENKENLRRVIEGILRRNVGFIGIVSRVQVVNDVRDLANYGVSASLRALFNPRYVDGFAGQLQVLNAKLSAMVNEAKSMKGGAGKIFVLGRWRKLYRKGSGYGVKYKGELISMSAAKRLMSHA